jgi:hypothetical protein
VFLQAHKSHLKYVCFRQKEKLAVIVVPGVYFHQQTYISITICVLRSERNFSFSHEDGGDDERRTFYATEEKKSITVGGSEDGGDNGDL